MENWGALDVLRDIRVELSRIRLLLSRETGDFAAFLDLKLKNEEDAERLAREQNDMQMAYGKVAPHSHPGLSPYNPNDCP